MSQNKKTNPGRSTLHGAPMTERYRSAAANDSLPRYRIMVVQDDFLLRMETAGDLRQWGYDVVEAFSDAEARRALHVDRRIALVLLDVNVGKDDSGLELARWIKRHHPETKLLLTAAVAPTADGIPVLDKPYRPLELRQHVDALLTAREPDQPGRGPVP
jgi:CheY-like chemotaxis protein